MTSLIGALFGLPPEAIAGFIGVLVGGLISGVTSYVTERRHEKRDARSAARLLEDEYGHLSARALYSFERPPATDLRQWERKFEGMSLEERVGMLLPPTRQRWTRWADVPLDLWLEQRAALSPVLEHEEWQKVRRVFAGIRRVAELAANAKTSDPPAWGPNSDKTVTESLIDVYDGLLTISEIAARRYFIEGPRRVFTTMRRT